MQTTALKHKIQTYQHTGYEESSSSSKQSFTSSTLSQKSMNDSEFSMSAKMLLPLVMRLKQENDDLSASKIKFHQQLTQLDQSGKFLLAQNHHLKSHYFSRTHDLQHLIRTLGINNSQSLQEIQQLIFSYRESNCKIYRDVHHTDEKIKKLSHQIIKLNEVIMKSKQQLVQQQKQVISSNVKNKKIKNSLEYLQKSSIHNKIETLENEINQKLIEITQIKQKNTFCLNIITKEKKNIHNDKPAIKQNTIKQLKKIQTSKQQIQQIQKQIHLQEDKLNIFAAKVETTFQERHQYQKQYIQKLNINNKYQHKIQSMVASITKEVKNLKISMKNYEEASAALKNQQNNLRNYKDKIIQTKLFQQHKLRNVERETARNIQTNKAKMNQIANAQQNFMTETVSQQTKKADLRISQLRQQFEDLQQKITEIEEHIDKQQTPAIQQGIVKMQYELSVQAAEPLMKLLKG